MDLAERYARQTLELLRATEDSYAVAHILETLAHICIELGRPEEALRLLAEGEPAVQASGTEADVMRYELERARALAALGETDEAMTTALDLAARLREESHCQCAVISSSCGDIREARRTRTCARGVRARDRDP